MAVPYKKDTVFHVETRAEAIDVLANGGDIAIHDHNTNPLIYHAASELIMRDDRGLKTDIHAIGLPHHVLQQVAGELQELGISAFSSRHIMDALQSYTVGLGADFAREAQAKPLYARVVVTDKKPDDMPDCELVQATMIDGERRLGDGVSQRVMQSTIYGTRTSMTKEMNLDEMFAASRKKWLLIYYGSPSSETYKGIEAADVALINLSQGLGGYLKPEQLDALENIITADEASPTLQTIINDFVEIERVKEQAIGQEAISATTQSEMVKRIEKIATSLQTIEQQDVVGEVFKPVIHEVLTQIARDYSLPVQQVLQQAFPQAIITGQASNDDVFAVPVASFINIDTATAMIEQMKTISKALSESNVVLSPADAEIQQSLQLVLTQLEGKSQIEAAKIIQQSINNPTNTAVTQAIQSAVVNMITPQSSSPQIQEMVRQFSTKNPSVVDVVATQAVIQQIESRLRGEAQPAITTSSSQLVTQLQITNPTELKQVLQLLKAEGVSGLVKMDAQSPVIQNMPASARDAIEQFVKQNPSVVEAVSTAQLVRQIESQIASKVDGQTNIASKADSPLQNLSQSDLKQVLQVVKAEGVAGLIKMDAQSPLTQNIPTSARDAIEQFVKQNPSVVEASTTAQLVRQIESQIASKADGQTNIASKADSPLQNLSQRDLKKVLDVVKAEGVAGLVKMDAQSPVIQNMPASARDAIEQYIKQNPSVVEATTTAQLVRQIESQMTIRTEEPTTRTSPTGNPVSERVESADLKQVPEVIKSVDYSAPTPQESFKNFSADKSETIVASVTAEPLINSQPSSLSTVVAHQPDTPNNQLPNTPSTPIGEERREATLPTAPSVSPSLNPIPEPHLPPVTPELIVPEFKVDPSYTDGGLGEERPKALSPVVEERKDPPPCPPGCNCRKLFEKAAAGTGQDNHPQPPKKKEINLTDHFSECADPNCQQCNKKASVSVASSSTEPVQDFDFS